MKVTPSDMGVCNTSQVSIPGHLIYGQTGRFLHVRPKLARIFSLKSYLFKGSFWRCLPGPRQTSISAINNSS